jgi:hypothetical protein
MRKGQSSVPNLLLDDGDGRTVAERSSAVDFGEETFEIEGLRVHGYLGPVLRARPLLVGPVAVELDPVAIRKGVIVEIAATLLPDERPLHF